MARRYDDFDEHLFEGPVKRFFRRILSTFFRLTVFLIVVGGVLVFFGPNLLSTDWGRAKIEQWVNRRIAGQVSIDSVSLSWFGEQSVAGAELRDPSGERVVRVTEAFLDSGLWEMLTTRKFIGRITLSNPQARIVFDDGTTNLHRALGWSERYVVSQDNTPAAKAPSAANQSKFTLRIPFTGEFAIDNGEIEIIQPGELPVIFSELSFRYQASERSGPVLIYGGGNTVQGTISGRFDSHIVIKGFDRRGELQVIHSPEGLFRTEIGSQINIRTNFQDMPVEGLDALFSIRFPKQKGLLTSALGDRLNWASMVTITPEDLLVQFKAGSPTLQANVSGHTDEGRFVLDSAGTTTFTITPEFFTAMKRYYPIPPALQLQQTSILNLNLDRLEIPLRDGGLRLAEMSFDGNMSLTDTVIVGDVQFGRLSLRDVQMTLKADQLAEGLRLNLSSDMQYNEWQSLINADVALKNILDKDDRLNLKEMSARVSINGSDLPVRVIDEWMAMDGMLVEALGEKLNFRIVTTTQAGDPVPQITLGLSSKTLQMQDAIFTVGDRWILQEDVPITYELNKALVNRFIPEEDPVRVEENIALKGTVSVLSFPNPLTKRPDFAPQDIVVQADTTAGKFRVSGLPQVGVAQLNNMQVEISGPNLASMEIKAAANVEAEDEETWVARAGGTKYDFSLDTGVRFGGEDQPVELVNAKVALKSDFIDSRLNLDMKGLTEVSLREPVTTTYLLNNETSQLLGFGGAGQASVVEPGRVSVTVNPFTFSFRDFDVPAAQLKGHMHFDQLGLRLPDTDVVTRLTDAKIAWEIDAPTNTLRFQMVADTGGENGEKGNINLKAQLLNWLVGEEFNIGRAQAGFNLRLSNVPVSMIEAITQQDGLREVLGPRVEGYVAAELNSLGPPRGPVAFELQGQDLTAKGSIIIDQLITLADPSQPMFLEWQVSPQRYDEVRSGLNKLLHGKLTKLEALRLKKTTTLKAVVSRLGFPTVWVNPRWASPIDEALPQTFDPNLAALSFAVDFNDLTLVEPTLGQELNFDDLRLVVDAPTFASTVNYSVISQGTLVDFQLEEQRIREREETLADYREDLERRGLFEEEIDEEVRKASGRTEVSRLAMRGTLSDFLDDDGNFQLMGSSIDLRLDARRIPMRILGRFLHLEPSTQEKLDAAFGKTLDAQGNAELQQMTGPVMFTLRSSGVNGAFQGEMVDGVFFLKEKATISVPVTPQLSKHVLRFVNPLLTSAITAEDLLYITVEPNGVEIPILPTVDWSRASIGEASVSMGKVKMTNKGPINSVLKLFKLSRLNNLNEMEVWFTPMYLSMRNGVIQVRRMDFLVADYFHLATWGKVDLAQDRIGLIVGFTSESLRNGFGIKGLPPDYMLTIPVRGSLSKPKVNKKHAGGRILALYAQAYGGEKGQLFGGIVDKVLKGDKAPKPTTFPIPWGNRDPLQWGEPDFFPEEDHPSQSFRPKTDFQIERDKRKSTLRYRDFKLKLKL